MSEAQATILVVDDETNMRHMLRALLSKNGYAVSEAKDGREALDILAQEDFDYILSDVRMPGMDGLTLLKRLAEIHNPATVIMMSAYGTAELAIEAMKQGAYDYISKPFNLDEALLVLRKAQERERLRRENQRLKEDLQALDGNSGFGGMVGNSAALQQVFKLATKVARFEATVLITGESGTGKELVARGIHRLSKGEAAPFVAVNCGGIPADLLESEFFGHVKGAFSGADRDKPGLFETAEGGSLFLDEIGEMPLAMQVKLLRVLQESEVRRVGAVQAKTVRVRVLAATNRDLAELVQQGRFRQDLYYRLNVFSLHLPPLREHREDILPLSVHFLKRLGQQMSREQLRLAPATQIELESRPWPGNVRELRSALERAIILVEGAEILPEHLPPRPDAPPPVVGDEAPSLAGILSLKTAKAIMERDLIRRAMAQCGGNKSRAAEVLEISYPALQAKLKSYGLEEVPVA